MTSARAESFRRRAAQHAASARRYQRNAAGLLAQGELESAGELLYCAAKRCINAVAGQRGENPVRTHEKVRSLRSIAAWSGAGIDLTNSWRAAARLHAHGDQSYLAANAFASDWATAQAFIAAMLEIYNRDNLTLGGQL